MSPEQLDFIFPFFVLAYGSLVTMVVSHPTLQALAETRLPAAAYEQLRAHRVLARVCLVVGGLWSLQNLWL